MTADAADDPDGRAATDGRTGRYDRLSLGDDEVVIFDRENYRAWLQSSETIVPGDHR